MAVVPGLGERLIERFEKQSDHRKALERMVVEHDIRRSSQGLQAGLAICALGLLLAGFVVYEGHDGAGAGLGGVTRVSLVGVFVYGTSSRRQERREGEDALLRAGSPPPQ